MTRSSSTNTRELPTTVSIPADGRILFFRRDRNDYFFLSHFHASDIFIDGETWPTVEHYFQAQKSFDPAYREAIRAYIHPGMAKRIAARPDGSRKISGQSWFRAHGQRYREDWPLVQLDIMRKADFAKFGQNLRLRELLLATDEAPIIEDTTSDSFWGIGPDGNGENWAGRILMEVRKRLSEVISEEST
jgi:ribA/ribD-fused uncharacterized protein